MTSEQLVERLRAIDHMSVEDCFLQSHLFAEAADEIDRLQGEVELYATVKHSTHWKARAEAAGAERDAAMEELGKVIMACPPGFRKGPPNADVRRLKECAKTADTLLQEAYHIIDDLIGYTTAVPPYEIENARRFITKGKPLAFHHIVCGDLAEKHGTQDSQTVNVGNKCAEDGQHISGTNCGGLVSALEEIAAARGSLTHGDNPDFVCDIADAALASATNSQIVPTSPRKVDVSSPLINSSLATREDGASVAPNPTNIPDDVWRAAYDVRCQFEDPVEAVARAIQAERQRCAQIAENSHVQTIRDRRQALAIAAAIRSLSADEAQP